MSFLDRVGNKVDNYKSKHTENSEISDIDKLIEKEKDSIDRYCFEIGKYYWSQYAKGDIDAPAEIKDYFDSIEESVRKVNSYNDQIQTRREEGAEERRTNDENTARLEEQKAADAERRRQERAQRKADAKALKAAESAAKEEEESLEQEKKEE